MTEPTGADRTWIDAFLDALEIKSFRLQAIDDFLRYVAAARDEVRREAIEECANLVNPGDWPTTIHRECAEDVNDAIRRLIERNC